jgi:prepilin-type N-terminal cleavage/methylation domain-containing protein
MQNSKFRIGSGARGGNFEFARRGFTLVELLIVVGIIVVLAAVLVVSFSGVFSKRDDAVAKTTIETLSANLQSYQTKWHSYPVSTLAALTAQTRLSMPVTDPNDTNMGIETLVIALRSKKNGGPYLDATLFGSDDFRKNHDGDELTDNAFEVKVHWACLKSSIPGARPTCTST